MPVTQPGEKTGTDSTGKRYKYEPGVRGRVALGGAKPAPKGRAPAKGKSSTANPKAVGAIVTGHNAFIKSGGAKYSVGAEHRLRSMLSAGRAEWLTAAPPDDARKAFVGALLGTIFNKGINPGKGAGANSSFKVAFNPGGKNGGGHITVSGADGTPIGSVKFNNLSQLTAKNINKVRQHFDAAVKAKATSPAAASPKPVPTPTPAKRNVTSAVEAFTQQLHGATPEEKAKLKKKYGDVLGALGKKKKK